MIPPVFPPLSPEPSGAATSPGVVGQAQAPQPLLQSSVVPAHNPAGFVFKIADTETGRVIVELPFEPDPNARAAEGAAKIDVRI